MTQDDVRKSRARLDELATMWRVLRRQQLGVAIALSLTICAVLPLTLFNPQLGLALFVAVLIAGSFFGRWQKSKNARYQSYRADVMRELPSEIRSALSRLSGAAADLRDANAKRNFWYAIALPFVGIGTVVAFSTANLAILVGFLVGLIGIAFRIIVTSREVVKASRILRGNTELSGELEFFETPGNDFTTLIATAGISQGFMAD